MKMIDKARGERLKLETIEQKTSRLLKAALDVQETYRFGDPPLYRHLLTTFNIERLIELAIAEEREACGWQPIETAPKDGTVIDLWCGGERYADCQWYKNEWREYRYDDFDSLALLPVERLPTHWMPLPTAPKDKVKV
jgi:hypothetical protein